MRAKLAAIGEVKNIRISVNDTRRAEVVDIDTQNFLIKGNRNEEDLSIEFIYMHIAIANLYGKSNFRQT